MQLKRLVVSIVAVLGISMSIISIDTSALTRQECLEKCKADQLAAEKAGRPVPMCDTQCVDAAPPLKAFRSQQVADCMTFENKTYSQCS